MSTSSNTPGISSAAIPQTLKLIRAAIRVNCFFAGVDCRKHKAARAQLPTSAIDFFLRSRSIDTSFALFKSDWQLINGDDDGLGCSDRCKGLNGTKCQLNKPIILDYHSVHRSCGFWPKKMTDAIAILPHSIFRMPTCRKGTLGFNAREPIKQSERGLTAESGVLRWCWLRL